MTLTFDCPFCGRELRFREYVWTHVHPTKWGRRIGAALLIVGTMNVAVGLGYLVRG